MKMKIQKNSQPNVNVPKTLATLALVYVLLVVLFYWLAGEQLHFRPSRGSIEQPTPETGAVELVQGTMVEQTFTVKIQRIKSVSLQWGTYDRTNNTGTAHMELCDARDGRLLADLSFDVASVGNGGITTLEADPPIESMCDVPLLLRVWADSYPGSASAPMMNTSATEDGSTLRVNGEPVEGMLCLSVSGEDYVWTGLHYWELAAGFGAALALFALLVWLRYKRGKHSYVVNALVAVKKYRFLIRQLVSRDFKTKYKRSVLGVFWSFLNPLLTMAVQYVVFSTIFRNDIQNFAVYLIIGVVFFNFFSEATNMALTSIIGNTTLITKVYMPKYIYPLTRVLSSLVNLEISLIPLLIVAFSSGLWPTKAYLLVPFVLVCLTVFSLGVGLLLAAAMVFFRDMQFLWGVMTMIWMYLTPLFYPAEILPKNVAWVLNVNPLYHFITFARTCIMDGVSPEPRMYVLCFLMALGALLVGALVFRKSQDRFVLYL